MNLIVGFGNPGKEYNFTRHNFGFLALDFYFKKQGIEWEKSEKFHAVWKKQGETVFLKPQTFYNDVGESIRACIDFYKIPLENILIICDDFNLPFGETRQREKGSAGGNNGLKSTISHLGTENFRRLRLGTGNEELRKKLGDTNFVLGKFTPEEKANLPEILAEISNKIEKYI